MQLITICSQHENMFTVPDQKGDFATLFNVRRLTRMPSQVSGGHDSNTRVMQLIPPPCSTLLMFHVHRPHHFASPGIPNNLIQTIIKPAVTSAELQIERAGLDTPAQTLSSHPSPSHAVDTVVTPSLGQPQRANLSVVIPDSTRTSIPSATPASGSSTTPSGLSALLGARKKAHRVASRSGIPSANALKSGDQRRSIMSHLTSEAEPINRQSPSGVSSTDQAS